ncbi:DUF6286 domain-containing protein [Rhodococcus gannanensis]|uniref:DUF6286 domain-containing protein n=1 Tax=Rhodococcus gannanensis TaxID=1960308 RepID=A0ABW4P8S4_9NOCA
MADPVAVTGEAPSGEPGSATPHSEVDLERGSRGELTIKDRAVSKIAVAAALSVPGVVRHTGRLLTLPARDLPRADVTAGPDSVAITLYVAVSWPSPVAVLSREVHATVAERVEVLTGMPLEHLHVVVAATVPREAGTSDVDARQLAAAYEQGATPVPSRPPLARPDAAIVAVVVAVLLIALGMVAGREFLIEQDVIAPAAWVRNSVNWLADLHSQTWMVPAAVAAGVIGLVVLCLALMPRTRTHVPAGDGGTGVVWLRPTDVARMCSARAGAVGGVTGVHTTVDRKRATVYVTPSGEVASDALAQQVRDAVEPSLAAVTSPTELRVRVGRAKS